MTAEMIEAIMLKVDSQGEESYTVALWEIAYQLAVANEREAEKQPLSYSDLIEARNFYEREQIKFAQRIQARAGPTTTFGASIPIPHFDSLERRQQRYWSRLAKAALRKRRSEPQDSQNPNPPED